MKRLMTRRCLALYFISLATLTVAQPGSAHADGLKLCNATSSRIGVAIGYQDQRGAATEGWWNIGAQTCETLLKNPPPSRYIYVHAIDYERGGEWAGDLNMCVGERSFLIREINNCEERGYQTAKFYEVDTGDANEWTIRLSDPEKTEK